MVERVFRLPDLGEGLEEAEISSWLVSEGEKVALNQPLVEVETAKAVVEILEGRLPREEWHSPLWSKRFFFVNPLMVRFFDRVLGIDPPEEDECRPQCRFPPASASSSTMRRPRERTSPTASSCTA